MNIVKITHANIDFIFETYPTANIFIFPAGDYYLTVPLEIRKNGIHFINNSITETVNIYQQTLNKDTISILSDNVNITGLTFYANGDGICIVINDCNWCNIEKCTFYGSSTDFTIFYSGPPHIAGPTTIDLYNNSELNKNNYFDNNIIYSSYVGDAISYSLQQFGSFKNNIIFGCKLALYMLKDTIISGNIIVNSVNNGILLSLPSSNITIENNYIKNAKEGGITIRDQLEHGPFINLDNNITLKNNVIIDNEYMSLEITNTNGINITNNKIMCVHLYGIYVLNSKNVTINNNDIIDTKTGIYVDVDNIDVNLLNNTIIVLDKNKSNHSMNLFSDCQLLNNNFYGYASSVTINDIFRNHDISNKKLSKFKNIYSLYI